MDSSLAIFPLILSSDKWFGLLLLPYVKQVFYASGMSILYAIIHDNKEVGNKTHQASRSNLHRIYILKSLIRTSCSIAVVRRIEPFLLRECNGWPLIRWFRTSTDRYRGHKALSMRLLDLISTQGRYRSIVDLFRPYCTSLERSKAILVKSCDDREVKTTCAIPSWKGS